MNYLLSLALVLAAANPISYQITVSTTIGEPKLTVFGYTSPQAQVQLQGNRVFEEVTADKKGYFFFDRVFLPRAQPNYPEVCLTSIRQLAEQKSITFPTCLPPLPIGPFEITVGPVLLPPTIDLQKGRFLAGQQITAQGLTIPNAEVAIFLANNPNSRRALIPSAHAHFLPNYKIQADKDGRFEFNLPTTRPTHWRIFASATFLGSPTPKSNTLMFKVLSWWEWWWRWLVTVLSQLFSLFKPYWWVLIILLEILLIAACLKKLFELKSSHNAQSVTKKEN
ncbi:MAG TPA: hypothetical protein VMX76_04065 [Nevskiaceae bacterium]|nr:hypothetical protein [Nevskiaceae bacterium]